MRFKLIDVWFCVADAGTSINTDILAQVRFCVNHNFLFHLFACGVLFGETEKPSIFNGFVLMLHIYTRFTTFYCLIFMPLKYLKIGGCVYMLYIAYCFFV